MTHPNRRLLSSLLVITAIALAWHTVVRGALPTVAAVLETEPKLDDDDADDPAIWVHPKDASHSLVLATLKEGGLDVYDLSGSLVQHVAPDAAPAGCPSTSSSWHTNGNANCDAIQEPSSAPQVRAAPGRRENLERDVRGVEPGDRWQTSSGAGPPQGEVDEEDAKDGPEDRPEDRPICAMTFDAFSRETVRVAGGAVCLRRAGNGPAVLLLHGFPETSLAWRKVAPALATQFTVIAADLPGYGDSTLSPEAFESGRVSKRTMSGVLADAMQVLGFAQFAVVGHDRGARVAYRLVLDYPDRIRALAVLDVLAILDMAEHLTYEAARQMGHWFWLTDSSRVPETLIGRDPDLYVRHIIREWGGAGGIDPEIVDEYVRCMRQPEVLRAMGAEYRADQIGGPTASRAAVCRAVTS